MLLKAMNKYIFVPVLGLAVSLPLAGSASWGDMWKIEMEDRQTKQEERQQERMNERQDRQKERQEKQETKSAERQQTFCDSLTSRFDEQSKQFDERKMNFSDTADDRAAKRQGDRETRDAKMNERRDATKSRREQMYQNLTNKANTDTEKAAVTAFQKTVETAVATRQAAVDAAIKNFRSGVDQIITNRKTSNATALATFRAAVKTAADKAEASCAAGADQATVRNEYRSAVQAAREALQVTRKGDTTVGDQVAALATARNKAVQAAVDTFVVTTKTAGDTLKAAFGETEAAE